MKFYTNRYKSDNEILLSDIKDKVKVSTTFEELKSLIGGLPIEKKLEIVDMFLSYRCGKDKDFIEYFCNYQIENNKKSELHFLGAARDPYWVEFYKGRENSYEAVSKRYGKVAKLWEEFRDKMLECLHT